MMTYVYTTDLANSCIVTVGENEAECRANAEVALPMLSGAKIMGSAPLSLAMVFCTSITLLSKARPDDVLIRKVLAHFGKDAAIELRNELQEDRTVTKHFLVDRKPQNDLKLKTVAQVEAYEKNGLSDDYLAIVLKRLEPFVRPAKPAADQELEVALTGSDNGENAPLEDR